jgi:hypothetical protein
MTAALETVGWECGVGRSGRGGWPSVPVLENPHNGLGLGDEGQDPKSAAALTEKEVGLEDTPDEVGPTFAESGLSLEVGRGLIGLGLGLSRRSRVEYEVVILVDGPGSEGIGPEIVWSMETRLRDLGENSPPSDLSSLRGPDERSLPSSPSPALSAESWSISTTRLHNPPTAGTNQRLGLENSPYPNLEAEVVTGADEGAEPGFSLECSVP